MVPGEYDDVREPDPETVLAIVVGAHLEAEVADRPLAYDLRRRIRGWQDEIACDDPLEPLVLTDLWYLNEQTLRLRPTITIGRPEVNAATAYLATKVPTAFVADDAFRIQLDPELLDERVCIWGVDHRTTADAVDFFRERYFDEFLRCAHRMPSDLV